MVKMLIFDDFLFEPITFVDLPWSARELLNRGYIQLPIYQPFDYTPGKIDEFVEYHNIVLKIEPFRRSHPQYGIQESLLAFTSKDKLARLLIPSWLPGQKDAVNELMLQNDHLTELIMEVLR